MKYELLFQSCPAYPAPTKCPKNKRSMRMEEAFADIMEKFVTPITVLVGLLGNVLSICVLLKDKKIQVRRPVNHQGRREDG